MVSTTCFLLFLVSIWYCHLQNSVGGDDEGLEGTTPDEITNLPTEESWNPNQFSTTITSDEPSTIPESTIFIESTIKKSTIPTYPPQIPSSGQMTITLKYVDETRTVHVAIANLIEASPEDYHQCYRGNNNREGAPVLEEGSIANGFQLSVNCFPQYYWCKFVYNSTTITSNTILANYGKMVDFSIILVNQDVSQNVSEILSEIASGLEQYAEIIDPDSIRPLQVFEVPNNYSILVHLTTYIFLVIKSSFPEISDIEQILDDMKLDYTNLRNSFYCPNDQTNISGTVLDWMETAIGSTVTPLQLCVQNNYLPVTRTCLGDYENGAFWSDVIGDCNSEAVTEITQSLDDLLHSNDTSETISRNLSEIIAKNKNEVSVADLDIAAKIMERLSNEYQVNLDDVGEIFNNLLTANDAALKNSQKLLNTTDKLLYQLDRILMVHEDAAFELENVVVKIVDLRERQIGWTVHKDQRYIFAPILENTTIEEVLMSKPELAVFLPQGLIEQLLSLSRFKVILTFFLKNTLFNEEDPVRIASNLVVAVTINYFTQFFNEPLSIIRKSQEDCAFWSYGLDEEHKAIKGRWDTTTWSNSSIDDMQVCEYSHVTHFGMIVSERDYSSTTAKILSVITIIGCCLSLGGVAVIFVVAVYFKSWRDEQGNLVLLNYLASILLTYVLLFLAGFDQNESLCRTVAVLLHYCILCQFGWMLVLSYMQYRRYVVVFNSHIDKLVLKSCLICWGFPALPVLTLLLAGKEHYGNNNAGICYVDDVYLEYAVIVPISIILTINLLIFAVIVYTLSQKSECHDVNVSAVLKLTYFLFFLLGLSWVFGVLLALGNSVLYSYLFCITCTSQGFVVSLTYILSSSTKTLILNLRKRALGCCKYNYKSR